MVGESSNDGWAEWSRHVLAELERLNECYIALDNTLDRKIGDLTTRISRLETSVSSEIEKLKVKSGVWGVFGGVCSILVIIAIRLLLSGGYK